MTTLTRADVYEKHADELIRFATGLVGPTDAHDVVADAMVRALWSTSWDGVRNPRAYLYKAVLNEARGHHRSKMRRRALEQKATSPQQRDLTPTIRPDVLDAVSRLSMSQRAVIFLAYWQDMRPAEIARHLGLSDGTVHRQLARGEARLRRILDD